MTKTFWTVGYAPYNRVPNAPIFTSKIPAQHLALIINHTGEYKGRGCKAVKCDSAGRLLR